jgi:hypothetical protein
MSADPFEVELRTMLAGRDPGPIPARLIQRVAAERGTPPRRFRGAPSGLMWLASAGATILVAFAIVIALGQRVPLTGPGASPAPVFTHPRLQTGDGVADGSFVPLAQAAVGLVVFGALVRVAFRASSRPLALAAVLGAVGLVWVTVNISKSDALVHEGGLSGVIPASSQQADEPGTFLGVTGNAPFHVVLTITNTSGLPLEVRGFAPPVVYPDLPQLAPRFVALGFYPTADPALIEDATPFRPTRLEPRGMVDLVLLGTAGLCALPVPPSDRIGGGFTTLDSVDIVYEQLTIVHTQAVALSDPVNVWWPDQCPSDLGSPSPAPTP